MLLSLSVCKRGEEVVFLGLLLLLWQLDRGVLSGRGSIQQRQNIIKFLGRKLLGLFRLVECTKQVDDRKWVVRLLVVIAFDVQGNQVVHHSSSCVGGLLCALLGLLLLMVVSNWFL